MFGANPSGESPCEPVRVTQSGRALRQTIQLVYVFGWLLTAACSSDHAPLVPTDRTPGDVGVGGKDCSVPNTGCDCAEEGAKDECGKVNTVAGDYVTCSMGTRTCTGGVWSECVGERTTTKNLPQSDDGLHWLALGSNTTCPPGFDPCHPSCSSTTDTPGDFNAGTNFSNTPSGLTIVGTYIPTCTSLSLTPSTTEVSLTGNSLATATAAPVTFTLTATPSSCITAPFATTWTIDKFDRATITGTDNTNGSLSVSVPMAGNIQVTAYAAGKSATTTIKTRINVLEAPLTDAAAYDNKAASATQISAFGTVSAPGAGSGSSSATWLYPYPATYFPLALPSPVASYRYANGAGDSTTAASAVKLSLRYPKNVSATAADFNYSVILREGNAIACNASASQCNFLDPQVIIPQLAWRYFEQTARGQDADILVQRLRARSSGSPVLEPEQRLMVHFVDGQLKGTVYYNSYTSPLGGNTGAILAIRPGATTPTLAVQPGGACTTCHSTNIDGTRLITNGGTTSGNLDNSGLYDLTTGSQVPLRSYNDGSTSENRFTFGGPWKDGSLYMTHGGGADPAWHAPTAASGLYNVAAGGTPIGVASWPSNIQAVTPRFTKDGTKLAFGFWTGNAIPCSTGAIAPCSGTSSRTLSSVSAGTRLAVMDFGCGSSTCTETSTGWNVTNARDVTPGVTEKVAWPSFTPDGSAVAYQRQYRSSKAVLSWTPSDIGTVAGALAEIWLSNVPANGGTAATPTRLLALNGLTSGGTSYLPQQARTVVDDATPLYTYKMARHELAQQYSANVTLAPQNATDPLITLSGIAVGGPWDARIRIIAGGARGTATFQYSTDGGTTYSGTTTTGSSVALGSTGITASFATGTYVANTVARGQANAVQIIGTPATSSWDVRIRIVAAGAVGTSTFQYSTNAGVTWSATTLTAARVALGATGLYAQFSSASYTASSAYAYAGSFGPGIVLTGGPAGGPWDVRFRIMGAGATGTATFQYSTNGGTTWSATTTTGSNVDLGSTGLRAVFSGTYNVQSYYSTFVGRAGLQGTPSGGPWDYRLQIVTPGLPGTGKFRHSSDAGVTWSAEVTTAATVSLGSSGLVATFANVNYPPGAIFGAFVSHYHQDNSTIQLHAADNCDNNATVTGSYDYRTNYLPSFAPTTAGGKSWVVFTSRRMWGNIAYENGWDAEPGYFCSSNKIPSKKLWIAAIDSTASGSWTPGSDPSHPAFYLPGQELAAGNSDGHWVNAACTPVDSACESDDDCCGGTGASPTTQCRVTSTATFPPTRLCQTRSSCANAGVSCSTTADCCSGLTCPSGGGLCLLEPPKLFEVQKTSREYTATCPANQGVRWRFFEWQSTIPTGTSIDFFIQTKQDVADSYRPADAGTLLMATASTTSTPGQWLRGMNTVDEKLKAEGLASLSMLKVTMVFRPNSGGTLAPTLLGWRQIYDCVPNE